MTEEPGRLWRPNRAARATGALVVLASVAGAVDLARLQHLAEAGVAIVLALGGWRYGLHPSLAATPRGVVIRNPLWRTTVAWEQIEGAIPGSSGIIVLRSDRGPVRAWAVQKANWSHFLGKRRRADEVAEYLTRCAKGHRAPT